MQCFVEFFYIVGVYWLNGFVDMWFWEVDWINLDICIFFVKCIVGVCIFEFNCDVNIIGFKFCNWFLVFVFCDEDLFKLFCSLVFLVYQFIISFQCIGIYFKVRYQFYLRFCYGFIDKYGSFGIIVVSQFFICINEFCCWVVSWGRVDIIDEVYNVAIVYIVDCRVDENWENILMCDGDMQFFC